MQKLPVWATASCVYRFLFDQFGTIVRLSWLPLLIVAIIDYLLRRAQVGALQSGTAGDGLASLQNYANVAVSILGGSVVAVALHRVILFGERRPGHFAHLAFGRTEMLFAGVWVAVFVATYVVLRWIVPFVFLAIALLSVFPLFLAALHGWCVLLAAAFFVVRLALIFPVIVVDGRYDFYRAWSLTRGNLWRIVGVWFVVFVPISLVATTLTYVTMAPVGGASVNVWTIFRIAVSCAWSIIFGALGVAMLSYSYKALSGWQPDDVLTRDA